MPNHKSAAKRVKQATTARIRNRSDRSTFRSSLKATEVALSAGDAEKAALEVQATLKVVGKTQKKGLIHANKAARHASRLTKKLNALKAGKA